MNDWALLDLPDHKTESELLELCWDYFRLTYIVDERGDHLAFRDWRGTLVKFSKYAFEHTVSGDENYRDGLGLHELKFVRNRAERLPWIGLTLTGICVTEVRHQERRGSRGRRLKRRVLIVSDKSYVVVLDREDDGCLRFRTAFPAAAGYLAKIRGEGAQIEVHRPSPEKKMPQS